MLIESMIFSNRIDNLEKQYQDFFQHMKNLDNQFSHLTMQVDDHNGKINILTSNSHQFDTEIQQTEEGILELHEICKEMTQHITENKHTTTYLDKMIQEMNHSNQPMIEKLVERMSENNSKIYQLEELINENYEEFNVYKADQSRKELWKDTLSSHRNENRIQSNMSGNIDNNNDNTNHFNYHSDYNNNNNNNNENTDRKTLSHRIMNNNDNNNNKTSIEDILNQQDEKFREIAITLDEQHTNSQESITRLSASYRKIKTKIKELTDRMTSIGEIKGSIDQILSEIIKDTSEDKHVIQTLKEENTQLTTEILSIKILMEHLDEKLVQLNQEFYKEKAEKEFSIKVQKNLLKIEEKLQDLERKMLLQDQIKSKQITIENNNDNDNDNNIPFNNNSNRNNKTINAHISLPNSSILRTEDRDGNQDNPMVLSEIQKSYNQTESINLTERDNQVLKHQENKKQQTIVFVPSTLSDRFSSLGLKSKEFSSPTENYQRNIITSNKSISFSSYPQPPFSSSSPQQSKYQLPSQLQPHPQSSYSNHDDNTSYISDSWHSNLLLNESKPNQLFLSSKLNDKNNLLSRYYFYYYCDI